MFAPRSPSPAPFPSSLWRDCFTLPKEESNGVDPPYSDVEMAELVGDMLSWIPRCILYVADFERRGKNGGIVGSDVWTRLLAMPCLGKAGADCEDVNGMVLELADRLQHMHVWAEQVRMVEVSDPVYGAVMAASRFLYQYTCGLGLGTLRVGEDKYEAHAHPIILDRRYVATLIEDNGQAEGTTRVAARMPYLPTLVVEGTNWCASAWDEQQMDDAEDRDQVDPVFERAEDFYSHRRAGKGAKSEAWLRRVLRSRIPALKMKVHRAYGTLTAILFPQFVPLAAQTHAEAEALHLVLKHTTQPQMGMPTNDLLLYRLTARNVVVHAHLAPEYILHIKGAMADFPTARIPACATLQRRESEAMAAQVNERRALQIKAGAACLSVRTQDAVEHQMEITAQVHAFRGATTRQPWTVRVTDDCQCTEIYV